MNTANGQNGGHTSERAMEMAECLKDAVTAVSLAGVTATSEDIRAIAIGFFIDKNKNARMDKLTDRMDKPVTSPMHSNTPPVTVQNQGSLGNCPKCGAPNKMSKQGKKYCSATCWTK